jgi:hypothetical protein
MPEAVWKAYIDFEIEMGKEEDMGDDQIIDRFEKARDLY